MAKRTLVIDSDDRGNFVLSIDGGALSLGDSPTHTLAVFRDLHISRIRCEIEVEEDVVTVSGSGAGRKLQVGEGLQVGRSTVRLEDIPLAEDSAETDLAEPREDDSVLWKQLKVVDGADEGRAFRLPKGGTITVGKSTKHADIILHDLYVSRVHCQFDIDGDRIVVTHREGDNGTRINNTRISEPQELHLGDVVRVGNSHLRLEIAVDEDSAEPESVEVEQEGSYGVSGHTSRTREVEPEEHGAAPGGDRLLRLENQVFGRYRVGALLGRGHSGVVFRAQDLKTNQVVALKVLSPDFPANAPELERFVQPLKVLPHLHHLNLLGLYGAGKTGAFCWISREQIEGESLARLTQRLKSEGKFNWSRAARVAIHLARVLGFLYQQKIVHGNITPANVLIRSSDKVTKLSDLMLAQALEGSALHENVLEHKLAVELPYLAPEQTESGAFVDHLADLYATGAVSYLLLTGRPPFSGETTEDLLEQVRGSQVVRPSKYQRGIPSSFEAVVLKLLAKHQEDRYQTPAELLADLEPMAEEHQIGV